MSESESVKFILRLVQEKHEVVKECLNKLFKVLASDAHADKVHANESLLDACQALNGILSGTDRPKWLSHLISEATVYNQHHKATGHNFRLLNNIVGQKQAVLSHSWSFETGGVKADYNFDSLYMRFKEESNLQVLFESMISTLEKMIESGEIDSLTALRSIEQLISVIKQNQEGSYFSVMASWEFVTSFTKNLVWQELSSLPVVKQLKSAFEKTVQDMDVELSNLHTEIAEEMKNKYETTISSLTHKRPSLLLLEESAAEKPNSNKSSNSDGKNAAGS